ncbi:MAG: divalent-cation tolerance protein CutA, partial [Candidatus Thorarchaeota archaeon]
QVVSATCPVENSKELAHILVETRLCACVNIIHNLTSIYHWKNEIVIDDESLLMIKTETKHSEALWECVKKNHPYEVPEFIVLPIKWGSQDYFDWISQSVKN